MTDDRFDELADRIGVEREQTRARIVSPPRVIGFGEFLATIRAEMIKKGRGSEPIVLVPVKR